MTEEIPFFAYRSGMGNAECPVDMTQVVGKCDIMFVCLDTLRYDAAIGEESGGGTPVLNRYGVWEKRQAPANFTYPSHHAIFSGFLPVKEETRNLAEREKLFFPKNAGAGKKIPKGTYAFETSNLVQGLHKDGYDTWCVGGVSFFDKRTDMGKVFPSFFEKSYWNPSFSCPVKESTANQVDFIINKLENCTDTRKIFLYLNVSSIHYPNYFYQEGTKKDSLETHRAALRYTDAQLGRLFDAWRDRRGETFVICFSDHGTCYGEDGFMFHGVNHPAVTTVPYKHFFL